MLVQNVLVVKRTMFQCFSANIVMQDVSVLKNARRVVGRIIKSCVKAL